MKIFLLNMPFQEAEYVDFSKKWKHIEDEYLGIGIVHTILENYGCEVNFCSGGNLESICKEIADYKPEIVMIGVMQASARLTLALVEKLRRNFFTGKIFIGGWFAKLAWQQIFQNGWAVDYVCFTDAEYVLPQWLANRDAEIFGIATPKNFESQRKILSSKFFRFDDLKKNYVSPKRRAGRKTYCIEMSRGCPHSACTFCSQTCTKFYRELWRPIPLEIVRNEIIKIHNHFGVTQFATSDDDLLGFKNSAKDRAKSILEMVKSLPFKIKFSASISVKSAADSEILDILQEAGLHQLCLGFESADNEQLRRYHKQQTLAENFKAAAAVRNRNLILLPGLITFDPFVTVESVKANLNFLFDELNHYDLGKLTKRLQLLTGTPAVESVKRQGLLKGDYLYYDYEFKDGAVKILYAEFQSYTELVKGIQKKLNAHGLTNNPTMNEYRRKIVEKILSGSEWRADVSAEISAAEMLINRKMKVENKL